MPENLTVNLQDGSVEIDRRAFIVLLDAGPMREYASYQSALKDGSITFVELKKLALKADVPYPLFFAPFDQVLIQQRDYNAQIELKLPGKKEFSLHSRGRLKVEDIKLIVKDISRKQIFLGRYILPNSPDNAFIGMAVRSVKQKESPVLIANNLRTALGIDLPTLRRGSKEKVVEYLVRCAEQNNIFVSFSSHNYMPQRLTGVEMSGFCIRDPRFPFIFIHTKDGDANPRVIEPAGRQAFTLVAMLVSIAMNKFVFNNRTKESKAPYLNDIYSIAGEFLIPASEIIGETATTTEDLKILSRRFKVTPSMCLSRLLELKQIDPITAGNLRKLLKQEIDRRPGRPQTVGEVTGYAKYNGTRFSREVLFAERRRTISSEQTRNILFRKGKSLGGRLMREYKTRFGL